MKLLWVDLEMSGLDVETCRIIEIAAIVTDENFVEAEEFHRIVKQDQAVLDAMDEWCQKTHGESGLTAAVPNGTPEPQAEQEFLDFIDKHFAADDPPVMAGNSIHQDRKFIDRYWPRVAGRLHYRMLDVSSFKIMYRARYGIEYVKGGAHRAVDDIRDSIKELDSYLSYVDPVRGQADTQ